MTCQVLESLRSLGPMTTRELSEHLGITLQSVNRAIKRLRGRPRQARVQSWAHEVGGLRQYLRAVYAVGYQRDAIKPPAIKITGTQHRKIVKMRYANSSIFRLAESARP